MTFKEMCKEENFKVPLSFKQLEYYTALGYNCIIIGFKKNKGHISCVPFRYENIALLTISDIRLLLKAKNQGEINMACLQIVENRGLKFSYDF